MKPTDKTLRILKLLRNHPKMTNSQIARKLGIPELVGESRVEIVRFAIMAGKNEKLR